MMTPTHILIAAAVLARPADTAAGRWRNAAAVAGALLPDAVIYGLFAWARLIAGIPERDLWTRVYWQADWQAALAAGNSVPLWGALFGLGLLVRWPLVVVVAAAALLHLACDFPVHADDAHSHFWPLTDWRFQSPISYWDERHHGDIVALVELALALGLLAVLWRRFRSWPVRLALGLALVSYAAVPVYFAVASG